MDKIRIIIFSSQEGLNLAQCVQSSFFPKEFAVKLWSNGFFELSKPYINNFDYIKEEYDFVIFIITGDDVVKYRNRKYIKPRDNIIFELGLCIGTFGLKKILIAKPDYVTLPSDLIGVEVYNYYLDTDIKITAGNIYSNFYEYIKKYSNQQVKKIDWNEYCFQISRLVNELKKPLYYGGFEFDLLIGVSRGGLMTADLISREYGHHMLVLPIYADRRNEVGVFDSTNILIDNRSIISILDNDKIRNILVVDCFSRRGKTILNAQKYLKSKLPKKCIKTALVYADISLNLDGVIDYIAEYRDLKNVTFYLK